MKVKRWMSAITPSKNRAAFRRARIGTKLIGDALVVCLIENEWNKTLKELIPEDDKNI